MHVVLDLNPVLRHRYSGFWTYGVSLLEGLSARGDVEALSLLASRESLAAAGDIRCWGHPAHRLVATRLKMRWWERWWGLSRRPNLADWCGPFDVYHSLHHLMPPAAGRPRVLTVHDLRRYRLGELYARSRTEPFERSVSAADRILAVSRCTRDDLVEILRVPPDKIDVVHEATPAGFAPADARRRAAVRRDLERQVGAAVGPYAVTISSRDPRKNLPRVVAAFARARGSLAADWRLVVVGQRPAGSDELDRAIAAHRAEPFVHFTGPASPARYADLLAAADVFVFLSLYEGFGLPVLEAMASGVPVLAADAASLPEVVGPDGVLADPADTDAAADALAALCGDGPRRRRLARQGLARAGHFTTQRMAEGTVACYRRAMAAGAG